MTDVLPGSRLRADCKNVDWLSDKLNDLVLVSQTKSTWNKHSSVWKCLENFALLEAITLHWPLDIETIRSFTVWCLCFKNLKPSTVKSYLSSVKLAHNLKGYECVDFGKDKLLNLALKGAENVRLIESGFCSHRRAATIHMLMLIGHRIACSN